MTLQETIDQGLKLHRAGRLAEAEPFYAAVLRAQPDLVSVLHLMGLLRFHQKDFPGARALMERALAQQPNSPETLYYYGLILSSLNDTHAALTALDRAIAVVPQNHPVAVQAMASRGDILLQQNMPTEALADLEKTLAVDPANVSAWNNHGLALNALKRHEEALASFERIIALAPNTVQAHNNRGDVLRELRRYDEALDSFARALALDPRDWATINNRAIAFSVMGRVDEALADYDRALAVKPNLIPALQARGNMLWSMKAQLVPAITDMERLIEIAPDTPFARGALMGLKMTAARWEDFKEQKALLDASVTADKPVVPPFIYLTLSDRLADLLRCARVYTRFHFPAQPALPKKERRPRERIRIGYVCGEFRPHAMFFLMVGMFEAHDKTAFEIFAFDNSDSDTSPLRARFEVAGHKIIDIAELSDQDAAMRVRDEEIDILVDMNGHSGKSRLGIFAHRPARIQISYLAYPGTLGAPYMDYIIADKVVVPEDEQSYYDEKIVWLPHSYQINDDKRAIAAKPDRAEENLPEGAFVFCNFNHTNKFTPSSFTIWMRLLANVQGSVLWLLQPDAIAQENLKREAMMRSIDPDRLIFAKSLPLEQHLARLALADLFIDTQPYGAHTTASDALWAGLPLLTLRGNSFAGRVATSLLTALELPELVTQNAAAFEAMALRLAREPELLAGLRGRLVKNRANTPLFDTARTSRAIERAYRMMLERQDASPRSFAVPDED